MAYPGRQWWRWNCPATGCEARDECVRTTDLPSECTVCYEPLDAGDKQLMTKEEIAAYNCNSGGPE